jgi:Ca2+-binding EF-hand superfamily protein
MTYCMFANTSGEMRQILDSLDEAFEFGYTLRLSADEKLAYEQLIHQCQRFLKLDELMRKLPEDTARHLFETDDTKYGYIDADELV